MMRVAAVLALMVWSWGAGLVYGAGLAQNEYCANALWPSAAPLKAFIWPLAAVAITLEGGWGKTEFICN